ncbi:Wzz/FepE/Etk N-terminal domain-containing protein [Polymorphobacter fuscus]|nr:Wzz/FepE/Etk N-terminal domain-containing protein [Polymorphobacter fuscus]NJC09949.1 LPS O-antigen subunit length determinant protein (WzzB/FepE family) [Polymorphobacter fuscus]
MSQMPQIREAEAPEAAALIGWITQLRRHRWLGIVLVVVSLSLAVGYLHIATYKYSAVLALTPADQSGQKPVGNLASLGSLVGVDLSSQAGSGFAMYAEAVTSYPVAKSLSERAALMQAIFKESWDPAAQQWREPQSFVRSIINGVKRLLGVPIKAWAPPDGHDLQNYIEKNVLVAEDKKKSLIRLTYLNADPKVAVELLAGINFEADNFLRARSLERSTRYVEYLERRLAEIQVVEYRLSMAQMLGNYEKTRMMASSDASFAAEAFGDIWVSPNFTTPNPWIVLSAAFIAAVALWIGLALFVLPLIAYLRRQSSAG